MLFLKSSKTLSLAPDLTMIFPKKLLNIRKAALVARRLQRTGKKVVFTNGTFDLLHLGHVEYLQKARSCGDALFVGVNTDRSVKSYKTPDRPINPEKDRTLVLAALACVDYVILFDTPTPLKLITALRPEVLVKGADWKKTAIAGASEVESWGGKIRLIRLTLGRSTTGMIERIRGGGPAVQSEHRLLYRILDANYNRAKEALRVSEDILRFSGKQPRQSARLKKLRHALTQIILELPASYRELLQCRDVVGDVGKNRMVQDRQSPKLADLLTANFKRAQEAVRVIEECSKLCAPKTTHFFQKLRFELYELEKDSITKF